MPNGRMTDDEFLSELRIRVLDAASDTNRLLRLDVEITESLRDMIAAARDEIVKRPRLFFSAPSAAPASPSNMVSEADIEGGQFGTLSGGQIPGIGEAILGLVREEKDLIKEIIRKLFNLP